MTSVPEVKGRVVSENFFGASCSSAGCQYVPGGRLKCLGVSPISSRRAPLREKLMYQNNQSAAGTHNESSEESDYVQEYLTFTLGAEEYAIDILRVQEIRGYDAVTTIANSPEFIKGVINLRGIIVPIVDMRIKFKVGKVEYTPFTVVIILNVGNRVVGMVVDSVSDVIALEPGHIRAAPEFASSVDTDYILGLGTVGERMLIVVDIEKLVLSREMALVDEVGATEV